MKYNVKTKPDIIVLYREDYLNYLDSIKSKLRENQQFYVYKSSTELGSLKIILSDKLEDYLSRMSNESRFLFIISNDNEKIELSKILNDLKPKQKLFYAIISKEIDEDELLNKICNPAQLEISNYLDNDPIESQSKPNSIRSRNLVPDDLNEIEDSLDSEIEGIAQSQPELPMDIPDSLPKEKSTSTEEEPPAKTADPVPQTLNMPPASHPSTSQPSAAPLNTPLTNKGTHALPSTSQPQITTTSQESDIGKSLSIDLQDDNNKEDRSFLAQKTIYPKGYKLVFTLWIFFLISVTLNVYVYYKSIEKIDFLEKRIYNLESNLHPQRVKIDTDFQNLSNEDLMKRLSEIEEQFETLSKKHGNK